MTHLLKNLIITGFKAQNNVGEERGSKSEGT